MFLFFDSGSADPNRFLMFSTTQHLKRLENSHLFCDGTFDITPDLFHQVYTIHAMIAQKCCPLEYVLLPKKTQNIYERMLSAINDKLYEKPASIMTDFERAFINACKSVFKGVPIQGCFFHFKQNIWRHIQSLGLVSLYTDDKDCNRKMKQLGALAFVPPADVIEAFDLIKSNLNAENNSLIKLYDYFEETYIRVNKEVARTRNNSKFERIKPMFDIELWNVYDRVVNNMPRTNNFVEAWYGAFSSMLNKHPNVNQLIDELRKEQNNTDTTIIQLDSGRIYKRKPKYVEIDERISNVVNNYNSKNKTEYINNICFLINY